MGSLVQTQTAGNAAAGTTVGATFGSNVTAGNLIHVFILYRTSEGTGHSVADSLGNTYTLIAQPVRGNRQMAHYYAANIAGGACTVTLTTPNSNQFRSLAVVEISGLDTVTPLDVHSSNVQETPGTGTDAVVSGAATATAAGYLSAAGIQVGDIGSGGPPAAGTGFTNDGTALPPVGVNQARLEHAAVTAGSWQATFTAGANVAHTAIMAIFKDAGGPADPTLTDADTDETVLDGQTGVAITGTYMGADETERTFTLRQGSTSVAQTETGSGTATAATLTIGIEQSGADIKFGAATLRVTRTADSAFGELAITVNPPTGQLYVDVGTPDTTAANRITAVADIASGDQIQARGVGGGAAPTGLQINANATFEFSAGNTPAAFDVRVWDTSDSTWGAWATQSMAGAEAVAFDTLTPTDSGVSTTERLSVAADTLTLTDSGVSITERVSAASDTLSLSDSSVSVTERVSTAADTLTLSDSAVGEVTSELAAVAEDALTPTDSALSITERVSVATDSLTLTEEATSTSERVSTAADTITLSDSAVGEATAEAVGEASDALTLTDSALSVTERVSTAADTLALSDSALSTTELLAVAADTLTASDSALAVSERLAVAVDTLTLSDSAVGEATSASVGTASDTVTLSDSAVSITERVSTATDTLTPTDSASSFAALIADASDAITVSDSAVGDAVTAVFADAEDSVTFSDASLAELSYAGIGEDSLALSDSATSFTERVSVAIDALVLNDEAQSYTERLAAALDAIGFSDSATAANASSFVDLAYIEFALRARRVEFSLRSQLMRLN